MSLENTGAGFLAANIMLAMMPEELILEKAFEALQDYKLKKDLGLEVEKPEADLFALLMKWRTTGKTPQEIIEQSKKVNDAHDYALRMSGDSANSN